MFPKKGKVFPKKDGKGPPRLSYASAIATALHEELGDTHRGIKLVMRWTGASERTAKNWFAGTRGPTGEHLVSLLCHSDGVLEILLRSAGRETSLAAISLTEVRTKLAELLGSIDELLNEGRNRHQGQTTNRN